MRITRNNYEQWLIDYMEGTLTPAMEDEVRSFLLANPDIEEEFEGIGEMGLDNESREEFPGTLELFAATSGLPDLDDSTIDLWLIARMEDDLTTDQTVILDEYLESHPSAMTDARLLEMTRLSPDHGLALPDKASLKRTQVKAAINQGNLTSWLIARMEGQTNEVENAAIAGYMREHPEAAGEEELILRTRMVPDTSLLFPGKDRLRRYAIPWVTQRTGNRFMYAAAVMVLLLGSTFWIRVFDNTPPGEIHMNTLAQSGIIIPDLREVKAEQGVRTVNVSSAASTPEHIPGSPINRVSPRTFRTPSTEMIATLSPRHLEVPVLALADATGGNQNAEQSPTRSMSLKEYAALRLRRFTYGDSEDLSTDSRISRWELADAGITGLNRLTGSQVKFDREVDQQGNLKSYKLGTDRYHFARK